MIFPNFNYIGKRFKLSHQDTNTVKNYINNNLENCNYRPLWWQRRHKNRNLNYADLWGHLPYTGAYGWMDGWRRGWRISSNGSGGGGTINSTLFRSYVANKIILLFISCLSNVTADLLSQLWLNFIGSCRRPRQSKNISTKFIITDCSNNNNNELIF